MAFRQARELSWRERMVLPQLMGLAIVFRLLLHAIPLATILRVRLTPLGARACRRTMLPLLCEFAAAFAPHAGRCLVSSILLFHLLKRRGEDARLCVGVRDTHPRFPAHAWVESDGWPCDGTALSGFATLVRLG